VLAARRDRRIRSLSRALRLCVLVRSLTALCSWRLLWAYRIDMLRELASVGPRLVDNQLAVIAIGAALAGNAVLAHEALAGGSAVRRAFRGSARLDRLAHDRGVVAGGMPPVTGSRAGVLGLSLGAALAPVLSAWAARLAARLAPEFGLLAIAAGAVLGKLAVPRSALVKLGLAYALVLAAHAALRRLLVHETSLGGRVLGIALLVLAALALARYDAVVTLAIRRARPHLRDAGRGPRRAYDAPQAARIGLLEREHARLLAVHGAAGDRARGRRRGVRAGRERSGAVRQRRDGRSSMRRWSSRRCSRPRRSSRAHIAAAGRRGCAPRSPRSRFGGERDMVVERGRRAARPSGARRVAAVLDPGYAGPARRADVRRECVGVARGRLAAHRRGGSLGRRGLLRRAVCAISASRDRSTTTTCRCSSRARTGAGGLTQTIGLLLVIAAGRVVRIASLRLRHASREHTARAGSSPRLSAARRVPAARVARRPAADGISCRAWASTARPTSGCSCSGRCGASCATTTRSTTNASAAPRGYGAPREIVLGALGVAAIRR